jgi:hypothetical protein
MNRGILIIQPYCIPFLCFLMSELVSNLKIFIIFVYLNKLYVIQIVYLRSKWTSFLRNEIPSTAETIGSWIQIPL